MGVPEESLTLNSCHGHPFMIRLILLNIIILSFALDFRQRVRLIVFRVFPDVS